jgi:hypothetical protein
LATDEGTLVVIDLVLSRTASGVVEEALEGFADHRVCPWIVEQALSVLVAEEQAVELEGQLLRVEVLRK